MFEKHMYIGKYKKTSTYITSHFSFGHTLERTERWAEIHTRTCISLSLRLLSLTSSRSVHIQNIRDRVNKADTGAPQT